MKNPVEKLGEEKVTKILQKKSLDLLIEVKRVFEENDIIFFLACGTALGCARHKGFIPWDDDIDIYVRGEDYVKIKKAIEEDKTGLLRFQDCSTDDNYPYWFPKIVAADSILVEKAFGDLEYSCGVYIDVFPIFYASNNLVIRFFQEINRYYKYAILRAYFNETFSSGIRKIIKNISRKITNPLRIQKKLQYMYCKKRKESEILIDSGVFHKNALLKARSFDECVKMKFENIEMPMPIGFKEYLTDYYGDYMQLPQETERISRHHIAILEIPGVKELEE